MFPTICICSDVCNILTMLKLLTILNGATRCVGDMIFISLISSSCGNVINLFKEMFLEVPRTSLM